MAILQYGLIYFNQIAIENATAQAGRSAAYGTRSAGCDVACTTQNLIKQTTQGLIGGSQTVITANLVANGGAAPPPDICQTNPITTPPSCATTFIDMNGNGSYDPPGPLILGSPGDLVEIRASYPMQLPIPMMRNFFGPNGIVIISSSTVVKNEP